MPFCQSKPVRSTKKGPKGSPCYADILSRFVQPWEDRINHASGICELDFHTFRRTYEISFFLNNRTVL